jgi:hypothetical protein
MTDDEAFRIREAVKDRLVDYWWDVDRNGAKGALAFYAEDCVYLMCDHRMEGHAPIKAYYDFRESRGARLVRHVVTNLRVHAQSHARATLDGTLTVYAADGVPVLPSAPPIMVADTECEFVRGADGVWRFKLHKIVALFQGGVQVLVPPAP